MEFQYEERICGARDVYAESDDEETLSFCDMPLYHSAELESTTRVSNADSSDQHDFHFDLDFGRSTSMAYSTSSADDLFRNGFLLPLSECTLHLSYSDSNPLGQKGLLLKEQLQARSDSLETKSSYWTSSTSDNSQTYHKSLNYSASKKGLRRVHSTAASNKSKGMANGSCSKTSSRWLQFFSLGIMKTPVMKVEDMRLRQCKRYENGVGKSLLKRSVSSYYKEGPIPMKKAATFQQRSKSVKENKRAVETPQTKGLKMLPLFTSLNSCRSSMNCVINCTQRKKEVANPKRIPDSMFGFATFLDQLTELLDPYISGPANLGGCTFVTKAE